MNRAFRSGNNTESVVSLVQFGRYGTYAENKTGIGFCFLETGNYGASDMPTAALRFRLPDESMEHRAALAGVNALIALEQINQWARGRLKYGEPSADEVHALEAVRAMIPPELLDILE